jgi:hypothetical protein
VISDVPESGGLMNQFLIRDLLLEDWELPGCPMVLSQHLNAEDPGNAQFYLNTRIFLGALEKEKSVAATATGNLNREFVNAIFDELVLPKPYRETTKRVCKVINEHDLWDLHLVRIICGISKLVVRRNKRFSITKVGRELLAAERAGDLYRRLFISYFRRFDLRYDFQLREVPSLQGTTAVILWRLSIVAKDWVPVRGLAPKILMPEVLAELRGAMVSTFDSEEWILSGYVLDPLRDLGLIETRKENDWPSVTEQDVIRITPLWRKFITFAA